MAAITLNSRYFGEATDWLMKKDPLDISYQINGDRLDIYDNTGFVRSIELLPER